MVERTTLLELDSPDPTKAINAFLWNMNKARSLGFTPKSEHVLAEHLFREDVKLIFYSSANGVISLCGSEDVLDEDDSVEILKFVVERRRESIRKRKAAVAIGEYAKAFGPEDEVEADADQPPASVTQPAPRPETVETAPTKRTKSKA